jgi:hypothetical protein
MWFSVSKVLKIISSLLINICRGLISLIDNRFEEETESFIVINERSLEILIIGFFGFSLMVREI